VLHRDLKPANVLLLEPADTPLEKCTPKVTDFGLARKMDAAGQTQSGVIMGTPSYMPPEQAGGQMKTLEPTADVYALGAILYELLTGRPPFKAATSLDTILQVLSEEPVPPSRLQPKTPRDLETICLKCLQKTPARRYATAAALAEDLRRFQASEPILARPVGRVERTLKWVRRRPAAAALLAVSVASLLLVLGVVSWYSAELYRSNQELTQGNQQLEAANTEVKQQRDNATEAKAQAEQRKTEAEQRKTEAEQAKARAEEQLDRARRNLMTAQLWRVAGVYERDPEQGKALLHDYNMCPLDLRDVAWRFYERQCSGSKTRTLSGRTGWVNSVAFSADGKTLASGSQDQTIKL
jgi:serine/threonine protein kinase